MKEEKTKASSKQKIIDKSLELFYKQGYIATGINQVIAESGVAKNTFYYYFPSKDDLCVSYLQEMDNIWMEEIKSLINSHKKPKDRLLAPIEFLRKWNERNDFRGCPFLNIASEITDPMSSIRKEVIYHKERYKAIISELVKDIKRQVPDFEKINHKRITEAYFLLSEGAIATCQYSRDTKPFLKAQQSIERLLNP